MTEIGQLTSNAIFVPSSKHGANKLIGPNDSGKIHHLRVLLQKRIVLLNNGRKLRVFVKVAMFSLVICDVSGWR